MNGMANRDTLKFSLELLRRVQRTEKVIATELHRQDRRLGGAVARRRLDSGVDGR